MTNTTEIDWSKAPEDATHYNTINDCWYRAGTSAVADILKNGVWEASIFTPKELRESSEALCGDRTFISRPVQMNKPPIGLMLNRIFVEWMQAQRQKDVKEAMLRYIEAGKDIPNEWLYELAQLNIDIQKIETDFSEAIESVPTKEAVAESRKCEWKWVENTQAKDYHPPTLDPQTYIEVVYRDGSTDTGIVADWELCWNTADNSSQDIVRYRILGGEE